jgi:DNA primase
MYSLQNKSGPISIGEAFIKDRDARTNDKDPKILIKQANSVDLQDVFNYYSIHIEGNRKCICPFPFHKGEKTGSFTYYRDTNSFFCFGCKSGGGPVNFVSLYDEIEREDAAKKIMDKFYANPNIVVRDPALFVERQHIMLEFSELIRNFIFDNLDDKQALTHVDKVTLIFDTINSRHNLDNEGLKSLIDKLHLKLKQYKS